MLGKSSRMLFPSQKEFELVGKNKYAQIRKTGTGIVETRLKRKNKVLIDVILNSTPLDRSNLNKGLVFTVMDVTEKKKAEKALKESETILRDNYEHAPTMFATVSSDTGKIINCNETFCEKTGYTKKELIGTHLLERYISKERAKQCFQQFIKTGKVNNARQQLKKKGGGFLDVLINASSIKNKKGKIIFSRSVLQDISELVLAEKALVESEKTFRLYIEKAPDSILVVNEKAKLIDCNPAACRLTEYARAELLQLQMTDLLLLEEKNLFPELFKKISLVGSMSGEFKLIKKNKSQTPIRLDATKLEKDRFLIFCKDVTEQKNALAETTKFNEFAVGRELRMVELKTKIKELKKQLQKKKNV